MSHNRRSDLSPAVSGQVGDSSHSAVHLDCPTVPHPKGGTGGTGQGQHHTEDKTEQLNLTAIKAVIREPPAAKGDIRAIAADRDHLRTILGLQPGERLCGATARDPWAISGPAATCLLPASHIDDGHWHRSLGGSWSL